MDPPQPPPPYDDFSFNYDSSRTFVLPSPPPLPPSAGLFSPSETTDFYGFLDNFAFDLDNFDAQGNPGLDPIPNIPHHQDGDSGGFGPPVTLPNVLAQSMHMPQNHNQKTGTADPPPNHSPSLDDLSPSLYERRGSTSSTSSNPADSNATPRPKQLLTTPQKRLNHIMSEQKRRNAIRDGYIQLTTLLAPAGAPPGAGMPTRGRPKGSGARGGRGGRGTAGFKGKSGILFRAVEYIRFLEEGREALLDEVLKVEAAAGIPHP